MDTKLYNTCRHLADKLRRQNMLGPPYADPELLDDVESAMAQAQDNVPLVRIGPGVGYYTDYWPPCRARTK